MLVSVGCLALRCHGVSLSRVLGDRDALGIAVTQKVKEPVARLNLGIRQISVGLEAEQAVEDVRSRLSAGSVEQHPCDLYDGRFSRCHGVSLSMNPSWLGVGGHSHPRDITDVGQIARES